MRLEDFAREGLVVKVRSRVLEEVVVFASDNARVDRVPPPRAQDAARPHGCRRIAADSRGQENVPRHHHRCLGCRRSTSALIRMPERTPAAVESTDFSCDAWSKLGPEGARVAVMAQTEALLREALKLSPEERADVAAELLASLDDVPVAEADEVERAWGAEIERRARRVLAGESPGLSWGKVQRDVRDRLAKR
jgi:putative addiction module component (TIGR02574 family)